MTLQEFADMTIEVIRKDGMGDYLPTLLYPQTKQLRAIQGIPDSVDHRDAIQNVVRRAGDDKREFYFGVCTQPGRITVGHFTPGQPTEFLEIMETSKGYSALLLQSCDWWSVR